MTRARTGHVEKRNMRADKEKKRTQTSSFGSSGRVSHDSTAFYTSRLYESLPGEQEVEYTENPIRPEFLNKILYKSSEAMDEG